MKKIITSVLMLVCFMFCFTACGEKLGEEYWLDTSAALTQYFATEEYQKVSQIIFSDNINTIMSQNYGREFAELESIYANLYTAAAFSAEKFATVLTVSPVNAEGDFKNKIIDVNNKLENLKDSIKQFLDAKVVYEARIDFTDELSVTSAIEKSRLVKFKMEYIKVIESAYNLSNSIYEAYVAGYYNFSDFKNIEQANFSANEIEVNRRLAINGSNLQLVNSAIKVLKVYNAKEIYYDYNNYWQVSQKFFTDVVEYAYNNDLSTDASILDKFVIWKGVYDEFVTDASRFSDIVANLQLDVLKKCNNDALQYANETGNPVDQGNANFFLNYYKNVKILFDYTVDLI